MFGSVKVFSNRTQKGAPKDSRRCVPIFLVEGPPLSRRGVSQFGLIFSFLFVHSLIWAQANVNESLEKAWIYVDTKQGSDSNPGTQNQPLKTIGTAASIALSNNRQKIGTRVIINPGTYREAITINGSNRNTDLPITFSAAKPGTVLVSGADVWTGWAKSNNLYTHAWPYRWGACAAQNPPAPPQQNIILRREMLLINGVSLTQVLSQSAMEPGTFFVNESNSSVSVWPPSGTNMSTANVEVATRPQLFIDQGQSYVVLRGLAFEYANSCRGTAAVSFTGTATNILVDSSVFIWNNAVGLAFLTPQNFTVQSSISNHNGQKGFATYQVKHGLWQSDTGNYNNWRGAQAAFYTFDSGSARFFLDHGSTFNNLTTLFNQTQGVHFDTDNVNVTMNSQLSANNLYGFWMENSQGPTTISNSYLCANNVINQNDSGGFNFHDSTNVTLTGNTIYGNLANQITINGKPAGFSVTNWETGQHYNLLNGNVTLSQNKIATNSNTTQLFYDGYLGGNNWTEFVNTLSSDNNTWSAGTKGQAFTVPVPKLTSFTTLNGWQSLTLQDMHSALGSVSQPQQCKVQAEGPDYWLISGNFNPVTASPSGQASFNLTTVALGGMNGTVTLRVDGLSKLPGATASFNPSTITTSSASVLTVVTGGSTPPGTYPVTVIANTGNVTRTIALSVVVPKTAVRLSTTSLSFGGQKVKTTSVAKTIKFTNTGSKAVAVSGISDSNDFHETNNCGSTLSAGARCTINVTFVPKSIRAISETLTIREGDPTSPQIVQLSGTGLAK
jgi:hypothetical protein